MDRKRPQTDDLSLKSPPGKILKTENDDSMDISNKEDISKLIKLDSPDDYLLAYQKEAIWRRMESYKSELAHTKERVNKLQNREQKYLDKFMILGKYWIKIEEEINHFSSKVENKEIAIDTDKIEFFKKLYQSEEDEKKLEIFEKLFLNYFNKMKTSLNKVLERKIEKPINEKELINRIEKQNKASSDNAITYQAKFEEANTKINDLEEQINDLKVQITTLENKLNKKKCLTTSAKYSTLNKDSAIGHSYSSDGKGDINIVKLNEEINIKSLLSEKRLEEIKSLEAERLRLNNEINEYKKKLIEIPDEQIIESSPYKSLQIQCGYLKSEADNCKAQLEKITREYETLKADRQSFMDQLEQEDRSRRKSFLSDIRKLEQEKTKLRSEKESLQQALELRNSKDQTEIYQNHEIRIIANTRKDRIICLEKQIQRLRMKMATDAGDKELLEMHDDATAEEIIERLRKQINEQKKELEEKTFKLKSYESIPKNENEQHEILLSNEHLKKDINSLKDKIKEYEKIYGITENPNTEKAVRDMAKKLSDYEEQNKQLELKCASQEKVYVKLLAELEKIGLAWQKLEDQNSRKVLDLTEKEVQIVKLIAEKTRYEQKCHELVKEKNVSNNLIIALKRQSDKQLELIRKLEDHEKNLTNLLSLAEKDSGNNMALIESHKRKALELTELYNEQKDKLDKANKKFMEMNNIIRDKTVALENEIAKNKRLGEDINVSKKRIETLSKYENIGDSNLQKQLDEYKALLKCPSCTLNFKDTVLLKCMHVFCKECIKARYDSRQRKCPTCGESFGNHDIKQI
eukprot:jgi/Orpsp1_1/1179393/evm.model.c7180000069144.1